MPIPVSQITKKHKLTPDDLKGYFDHKSIEKRPKVKELVNRIRDTIQEGLERNRRDYRLYKSMDWAMDQPFYQVSYTQLRELLSRKPDDEKVLQTVNSWGLTHLLPDRMEGGRVCCDKDGNKLKVVNIPFLTNIFVPICMAYHNIRLAKLFNDRNLVPLYKYEPVQFTKENRIRCEIVTQVVQKQAAQFDYKADERQSISQMLQYGYCINFPREAWYTEKHEIDGKEKVIKEGLRFNMPHPSRVYYDPYNRLSTLNSNSGCQYAGYWALERYADLKSNKHFWNTDRIAIGAHSWLGLDVAGSDFLAEAYPCQMKYPDAYRSNGVGGVGALDREEDAGRFYNTSNPNVASLVTNHFQKIVPSDCGLGTYEHPLWFRFVMASENTILWAEPLAYDRLPTYAYDADFNRSRFRSLTLEVMPFQDQVGNLLSQWGRSVRENLRNPIFVDKEKVPANALQALENVGNKNNEGRQYILFSSTENYRMKVDQKEAFFTPQMTHHNTAEISQLITGVLDMLDRIMQLSPQEVGQAASHEQTAEESRIVANNMSTRVAFTGSFIDDAIYAKKVMIYDATMEYADDEIMVGISSSLVSSEEEFKKITTKLGLTIMDDSKYSSDDPNAVIKVKATKAAMSLETFASTRDADTRINNPALADAMSKIFISIAGNPVLIQSIGAPQLVELLNQVIVAAGLPKEFRLQGKVIEDLQQSGAKPEELQAQIKEMMTSFAEQVRTLVDESQKQTLEAAAEQTNQIVGQAIKATVEQMTPVAQATQQAGQAAVQATQENQQQQQQIDALAQALQTLNQKIDQAMAAAAQAVTTTVTQPPGLMQSPMVPLTPPAPVGMPV